MVIIIIIMKIIIIIIYISYRMVHHDINNTYPLTFFILFLNLSNVLIYATVHAGVINCNYNIIII